MMCDSGGALFYRFHSFHSSAPPFYVTTPHLYLEAYKFLCVSVATLKKLHVLKSIRKLIWINTLPLRKKLSYVILCKSVF